MPYDIQTNVMTPPEIVAELDKYIIGQKDAKRAVAIAVRNRWRRMQLEPELRAEIKPKNILMIGPTGVGKTEIARRLAKIANAPFLKVEATKFTEVGYVGRDVDSIIRDLMDVAISDMRKIAMESVKEKAQLAAEDRILDILVPKPPKDPLSEANPEETGARHLYRKKLHENKLDDKEIEIDLSTTIGVEIMAPPGMEEMTQQLQSMFQNMSSDKKRKRKMKIKDALKL